MKLITKLLIGSVFISLILSACEQTSMVDPVSESSQTVVRTTDKNITLVPFTDLHKRQINKIVEVSSYVTYANGGKLELNYDDDIEIEVEFEVPKYSISEDATLAINIDTDNFVGNFDVTFYPHGITFSDPAILNIEAEDLDLTGVDPNAVKIYYDNQETGIWEEMECERIDVFLSEGKVKVKNAKIPHFSRYAIGTE